MASVRLGSRLQLSLFNCGKFRSAAVLSALALTNSLSVTAHFMTQPSLLSAGHTN